MNWCNPPYGRGLIAWINRAAEMKRSHNCSTVMLLPARTDTKWFHAAMGSIDSVRFIKGRLTFQGEETGAPFPSQLLIWGPPTNWQNGEEGTHKWHEMLL